MKRVTKTELLILRELVTQPAGMYGLEIVEKSNGRVKRGSVYVLLSRLKSEGFVDDNKKVTPPEGYGGMRRPIYEITAKGRLVVEAEDYRELILAGASV